MDKAKIGLSPEELALVSRADWILTKNSIIRKVDGLLSFLQTRQQGVLESISDLPAEIMQSSPKISKGENYKGLPWLMLDYPKYFNREDIFAIRSFFWWGNFFSTTLHLSGRYKEKYENRIRASFASLKRDEFFVCHNEDQWEHHFEANNYLQVADLDNTQFDNITRQKPFIKLAKKTSLLQWDEVDKELMKIFDQLINTLKN